MADKYRSETDFFGTIHHYDEKGKEIGRSEPGFLGGFTNYDADGKKVGRSEENFFGGFTNYDDHGNKIGSSYPDLFGNEYSHYDSHGNKVASSDPGLFGRYTYNDYESEKRDKDKDEDKGYKRVSTSYSGSSYEYKPPHGTLYDGVFYYIDGRRYTRGDLKKLGFNYRIIERPREHLDYEEQVDRLREKLKTYVPEYKDYTNLILFLIGLGIVFLAILGNIVG